MENSPDYKKILIEYILIIMNKESITFLDYYEGDETIGELTKEETEALRKAAEEARKRY